MVANAKDLVGFWGNLSLPFSPVGINSIRSVLSESGLEDDGSLGLFDRVFRGNLSKLEELERRYLLWTFYITGYDVDYVFTFILDDLRTLSVIVSTEDDYVPVYVDEVRFIPSEDDSYLKKHIATILLKFVPYDSLLNYFNSLELFKNGVYRTSKDYMSNLSFDDIYGSCHTGIGFTKPVRISDIVRNQGFYGYVEFFGAYGAEHFESMGFTVSELFFAVTNGTWYVVRSRVNPVSVETEADTRFTSADTFDGYGILVGFYCSDYYILTIPNRALLDAGVKPMIEFYDRLSGDVINKRLTEVILNHSISWDNSDLLGYAYNEANNQ